MRLDIKDPIGELMKEAGVPSEPCVMRPDSTVVFSFPIASPSSALVQDNMAARDQLDMWKQWQLHYCDHKPSYVSYEDNEFLSAGQWVWNNWDIVSGISFLPKDDHVYQQAPFEAITEDKYEELQSAMPSSVDWSLLSKYELQDETEHNHTLSCSAGGCEIV